MDLFLLPFDFAESAVLHFSMVFIASRNQNATRSCGRNLAFKNVVKGYSEDRGLTFDINCAI